MASKHELHQKGLRLTPQRELVLAAVRELGHATPEEVAEKVRQTHPGINLSTVYRNLIQPRLSGPVPSENEAAPRFAQLIGALFAFVALLGGVTGNTPLFLTATSFALAAAFLNAAFGFCLGCQMYLILVRVRARFSKKISLN